MGIGRLNKGYMVELTEPYLEEVDWFIPQESIDDEDYKRMAYEQFTRLGKKAYPVLWNLPYII